MLLTSLDPAQPDHAAAVTIGRDGLSRADLLAAASAVADRIAGATRVAVDATASLDTVVAVVGGLLAGAAVVPVPPDSGPVELAHVLTDSGAEVWLCNRPTDAGVPVVPVDPAARSSCTYPEPDPSATGLIMYTSGTTGAPKGVLLSRGAMSAGIDGLADAWGWTPDDTLAHGLPLFHVHGLVLGVLGALRIGSPLRHTVRPTAEAYAAACGSLYFGVPTVWSRVCADESAARALSGARLLVSGSAALPVTVFEKLAALTGHRPIERYGMTETMITLSTRVDGERRPGWVGLPITTPQGAIETRLRGPDGTDVPHDGESVGDLELRGPTLFDGYLGRPEATAEAWTSDGWFRTGDIAATDERGTHRIVGRASTDLIKSGGYRIGAGEIENALLAHESVAEAAVIGEPDDDLGQRIVAYVVSSGAGIDPRALTDFVAGTLSVHKRPREVRVVDSLPRNAMGKVQKGALLGR